MLSKHFLFTVLIATLFTAAHAQVKAPSHLVQKQLVSVYVGQATTWHQTLDVRVAIYSRKTDVFVNNRPFPDLELKPTGTGSYTLRFQDGSNDVVFTITFYINGTATGTVDIYTGGIFTEGTLNLIDSARLRR